MRGLRHRATASSPTSDRSFPRFCFPHFRVSHIVCGFVPESPSSNEPLKARKTLDLFRAKTRRSAIHPLELAALWVIAAHLVFLPWALGTMRPWAQFISLGFSVLGFGLAVLPRNYTEEHTGSRRFRLLMWPKLVRFPIFWLGLALLGLVVLQALNPAWEYKSDAKNFWMQEVAHKAWLPHGVRAPFERWNQWRMLVIYSSALLTVCSIWVAFTRRRTLQALLLALAANGVLLAVVGVAQLMLRADKIFGIITSPNRRFFSSFIYKNHGAAYLGLAMALTAGLAGWFYLRGIRRMEKSNPSGVLAFFATLIAVSIITSYARGATLMMLVFVIGAVGAFVVHQFRLPSENRRPLIVVALLLLCGFFLKTGLGALQSGEAWDRIRQGIARQDNSLVLRERVTTVSLQMVRETWPQGIGVGAFRFIFPIYQHRDPKLVIDENKRLMFWEHAHNDVVELLAELGAVGTFIIVLGFGYWAFALLKSYFWENPLSSCIVFGLLLLLAYAWWDFPFQCPAILTTWCALWAVATMWARFEEAGGRS